MSLLIDNLDIVWPLVAVAYALALVCAVRELLYGRTSQGSIGWLLSLFFFPYVTVLLYLAFGWKRFDDYVRMRRRTGSGVTFTRITGFDSDLRVGHLHTGASQQWPLLANVAPLPFLAGNRVKVLVNGGETFGSIFAGIRAARSYVLVQYYTLRSDRLGRELADLLIERAGDGLKILVLYDDVGSSGLSRRYLRRLQKAGIEVCGFNRRRPNFTLLRPFRINFRNHRKIVIADGHTAWIGGHNVGDEYMGRTSTFAHWRDTHVRVEGPAALAAQVSFAEDWHWATGDALPVDWPSPEADPKGVPVLVMPSGPADVSETCAIAFTEVIGRARQRLWIVSPYFVPGEDIQTALAAAVLRGVEVRVLLPRKSDNRMVALASSNYAEALSAQGVQFHFYEAGFLHQKVVLVDDVLTSIGTANFDNRSFHINFEITLWFTDAATIAFVQRMLAADFGQSRRVTNEDLCNRPLWHRLAARLARLFAPLL